MFELAVIATAGVVGMSIGGSAGNLVVLIGLLPSITMTAVRRRIHRLVIDERRPQLDRAVAMLDVLSWPVRDQPFNVTAHLALAELDDDPRAIEEFLQRERRRPTTALKLARALHSGDRALARELATELLQRPHGVEERFTGFRALLRVDLSAALEWYASPAAARMRKHGGAGVDVQILTASGRVEPLMWLLGHVPVSDIERDTYHARALLGRGDSAAARDLLLGHGSRGQAKMERLVRAGDGPQPLSPNGVAVVDEVAGRAAAQAATIGRDTGRWRPVLTWILGAVLILSYLRQTNEGFTDQALYDQGAFVTGRYREWSRALSAPYVHANAAHLLYNFVGLLGIGRVVESRITRWQYVAAWLLTSSGSFVFFGLIASKDQLAVGASGGVLGLLGVGLAVIGVQLKRHRTETLKLGFRFLLVLVAFQLVADHLVPNVAWIGHLTGLAIGCVLGLAFAARQPRTGAIGPFDTSDAAIVD